MPFNELKLAVPAGIQDKVVPPLLDRTYPLLPVVVGNIARRDVLSSKARVPDLFTNEKVLSEVVMFAALTIALKAEATAPVPPCKLIVPSGL
jgi:hypothetical protein